MQEAKPRKVECVMVFGFVVSLSREFKHLEIPVMFHTPLVGGARHAGYKE